MGWIEIIGLVAASLTTFSFLPQVIKVWRSRSAKDFSVAYLITLNLGILLWLIYGLLIYKTPVIVANALTLLLTLTMLLLKLKHG